MAISVRPLHDVFTAEVGGVDLTRPLSREDVAAIETAGRGLIDADLGGGLIKQRVARPGQGKRGGFRMMIAFRRADLPQSCPGQFRPRRRQANI